MSANIRRRFFDLMVTRLPWTVGNNELREYFGQYGSVKACRVLFDKQTGFSKGFGFVCFSNPATVHSALKKKYHVMEGQRVHVQLNKSDEGTVASKNLRLSDILDSENV